MTIFQRSLCLFLSLFLAGSLIFSEAQARRDKRGKSDAHPVELVPEEKLMGKNSDQILALLGAPSFKRSENGAEVWQYKESGCVLDLFLFVKPPQEAVQVQYLDVFAETQKLDAPVSPDDRQHCLKVFTDRPAPNTLPK